MFSVLVPFQKSRIYQVVESAGKHRGGNIKTFLYVIETSMPQEQYVAQNQWRPPLANNLKRLGNWAIHVLEGLSLHSL